MKLDDPEMLWGTPKVEEDCTFLEKYDKIRYCKKRGSCQHQSKEKLPYVTGTEVGGREYLCKKR